MISKSQDIPKPTIVYLYFLSSFNKITKTRSIKKIYNIITGQSITYTDKFEELLPKILNQQIEKIEPCNINKIIQILTVELLFRGIIVPEQQRQTEEEYLLDNILIREQNSKFFKSNYINISQLSSTKLESKESKNILFVGIPYDIGATKPGTRYGPEILRSKSNISLFRSDNSFILDLTTTINIFEYKNIFDLGNIHLPPNKLINSLNKVEYISSILPHYLTPFFIGGDHLFTLPIIRGLYKRRKNFTIIQFDHHLDVQLWGDFNNNKPKKLTTPSHANFISWIKHEMPEIEIIQIGVHAYQSINDENFVQIKTYLKHIGKQITDIEILLGNMVGVLEKLPKNQDVYITLDVDVLSSFYMNLTGYPAAVGIGIRDLLQLINNVCKNNNLIGVDIMEFGQSNKHDIHQQNANLIITIILEILKNIK